MPPSAPAGEDPFLTGENKPLNRRKRVQAPAKDALLAVALPWLTSALVLFLFLFAYQDLAVLVWAVIALCMGLSLLFLILGRSVNNLTFMVIGAMSLLCVVLASAIGLWLNDAFLVSYSWLDSSTELKDVDPTGGLSSHEEVGIFRFVAGTFVDNFRTLGFVAEGEIFCVAPVSLASSSAAVNATIAYWAAGQNCCEKRSNFDCGAARESDLSTIAAVSAEQAYSWNQKSELVYFRRAIAQAEAVYGVKSTNATRLLSFVKSPQEITGDLWDQALQAVLLSCMFFLIVSGTAGLLLGKFLAASSPSAANLSM